MHHPALLRCPKNVLLQVRLLSCGTVVTAFAAQVSRSVLEVHKKHPFPGQFITGDHTATLRLRVALIRSRQWSAWVEELRIWCGITWNEYATALALRRCWSDVQKRQAFLDTTPSRASSSYTFLRAATTSEQCNKCLRVQTVALLCSAFMWPCVLDGRFRLMESSLGDLRAAMVMRGGGLPETPITATAGTDCSRGIKEKNNHWLGICGFRRR